MTKLWRAVREERGKLSRARRAQVDEAVAREALELSLRDLREQCGFTQEQIADALEMAQGTFSRLERRDDHLVSTPQGRQGARRRTRGYGAVQR